MRYDLYLLLRYLKYIKVYFTASKVYFFVSKIRFLEKNGDFHIFIFGLPVDSGTKRNGSKSLKN